MVPPRKSKVRLFAGPLCVGFVFEAVLLLRPWRIDFVESPCVGIVSEVEALSDEMTERTVLHAAHGRGEPLHAILCLLVALQRERQVRPEADGPRALEV